MLCSSLRAIRFWNVRLFWGCLTVQFSSSRRRTRPSFERMIMMKIEKIVSRCCCIVCYMFYGFVSFWLIWSEMSFKWRDGILMFWACPCNLACEAHYFCAKAHDAIMFLASLNEDDGNGCLVEVRESSGRYRWGRRDSFGMKTFFIKQRDGTLA